MKTRRASARVAARIAAALVPLVGFACKGAATTGSTPTVGDAGFSITLAPLMDAGPQHPYSVSKGQHWVSLKYRVTVTNFGPGDLYDLRAVFPVPAAYKSGGTVSIGGGWYNDVIRSAMRIFDWLPPEQGPIKFDVSFERDPNIFSADSNALSGDITFSATASVTQYDVTVAATNEVLATAYMPARMSTQDFAFYSGQVDGPHLYMSARPGSGDHSGRGGVYRVWLPIDAGTDAGADAGADAGLGAGSVEAIGQHTIRNDLMAPFLIDGDALYYVTDPPDGGPSTDVLMKLAKDGDGGRTVVPMPADMNRIYAIAADSTYLFAVLKKLNNLFVVYRCRKDNPTQGIATSAQFGSLKEDTVALTTGFVVVLEDDPAAIYTLPKDTLIPTKLIDLGSTTGRKSLACNDAYCFWTEWSDGFLFQFPLPAISPDGGVDAGADAGADAGTDAGTKTKLTSTNQPILFDGTNIYSGINGLIRVGPNQKPPTQTLFVTGVVPLLALDANYIYFGYDNRVWRLHK